jgi:hypothetical protein
MPLRFVYADPRYFVLYLLPSKQASGILPQRPSRLRYAKRQGRS